MILEKGTKKEIEQTVAIAKTLSQWFTPDAINNIRIDLEYNSFFVAKESGRMVGFLCHTTSSGKALLLWMGIVPEMQNKGVGTALLEALESWAKQLHLHSIEVETLPEEDSYKPYKQTRDFYYKNGFTRILYKKATKEGWDDQILLEKELL